MAPPHSGRLNIAELFVDRHVTDGRGSRVAFRHAGASVSYAEVADEVSRAAGVLAALGVEPEQRVLLALDDSPRFALAFWAVAKLGAVAVPVNTLMSAEEYEFLLADSRARIAIVEEAVAPRVLAGRSRCPLLREVLAAGEFDARRISAAPVREAAPTVADDIVYWGYTSGSTGKPKAAVHCHSDFVAAADLVGVGVFGLSPEDRTFSASKMFFAFGLGNSLYFPARIGASSVLVSERMDAHRAFETIGAERPTVFFAVPTLYARMLAIDDAEAKYDLTSLRYCVSSGEALPPTVFDAWADRFGLELVEVVGSTEALHDFIANRPGEARRGSAGRIVPGFEARVEDDAGRPAPDGAAGHLLIKGPTTSPYYWNRRERTRATMLGEWLRTGDMFARDGDGWFTFAGRSDDMLKVGGQWVAPAEVEAILCEHPGVLEAGVVGAEDARGLIRPRAFVVLKDGWKPSEEVRRAIRDVVAARAPAFKVPEAIDFVADLPKTPTGKVQRFRLRQSPV